MKIQVIAEREQKIQIEVKEIRKVFFCDLCNKQYKLAMEFETHLSSYDHNHRKRFKEMREMQSTGSRDDRQKRELIRQEKEMAKFTQMVDAQKQRQQLQQQELSIDVPDSSNVSDNSTPVPVLDQRPTLKFGFSSKLGGPSKKMATVKTAKKQIGRAHV